MTVAHDVYLLRHGETEWNKDLRIQGQLDSPLTRLGQSQAKRQAHTLRRVRASLSHHTLWASPLGRAQETASLALDGVAFATDPRLAEIHCGQWEGLTHAERLSRDPDIVATIETEFEMYANTPEGERIPDLAARLVSFLSDLDAPAIIVSHKITLVVMRALLIGGDAPLDADFAPTQGSILQISNAAAIAHIGPKRVQENDLYP